jgi:hypothetical protein
LKGLTDVPVVVVVDPVDLDAEVLIKADVERWLRLAGVNVVPFAAVMGRLGAGALVVSVTRVTHSATLSAFSLRVEVMQDVIADSGTERPCRCIDLVGAGGQVRRQRWTRLRRSATSSRRR